MVLYKKDAKNVGLVFGSKIIVTTLNILGQIILARLLGPQGRGEYTICIIFSIIIGTIFFLGYDVGIRNQLVNNRISLNNSFTYLLLFTLLFSLIAIIFGYYLSKLDIAFFRKASSSNLIISLFIIPFQQIFTQQIILLNTSKKFFESSIFLVIAETIRVLFIYVLIVSINLSIKGALISNILSYFLISIFILIKTNYIKDKDSFIITTEKTLLIIKHGLKYYIGKLSNISNVHLSTILIAFFLSKELLGIYAVGSALILKIQLLPDSINSIIIPKMRIDKRDNNHKIIITTALLNSIICGIIILIISIFSNWIVMLLFGNEFLLSAQVVRIIGFGIWFRCISKPIESYYAIISNKPHIASFAVFIGLLLNLISLFILIPILGIRGAAISSSINLISSSFIFIFIFFKDCKLNLFELYNERNQIFNKLLSTLKNK